jgi:hypothetical protein
MRKNVFNLYASADDLIGVLSEVEQGRTLRYVALEDELNPNLSIWRAAADIPDFIQPKSPGLPRRLYIMATDEQLVPEPPVEALDESVLHWLAGCDVVPLDPGALAPG